MSKIQTKGTLLQIDIASVMTTVAQVISMTPPSKKSETYDSTTLDQADNGKEKEPTGYVEPGNLQADLFWDPDLASHAELDAIVNTPQKRDAQVVTNAATLTDYEFEIAGLTLSPAVSMNDGLKMSIDAEVSGRPILA